MISRSDLEANYKEVQERVAQAAVRSGRKPEDVLLLPVTKTLDAQVLQMAYEMGMRQCGENRVQEILAKKPVLPEDLVFHMIGHLQKNKVHQVIDQVALIHSVDSLELAKVIEKEAAKRNIRARILIQLNVAQEETKFGISSEEAIALAEAISHLEHIEVCGLMTVAPFVEDPEENREVFAEMRKIYIDIAEKNFDNVNMSVLSMGMTNDYEVAIEEGATLVRVGTGIFGERNYNK